MREFEERLKKIEYHQKLLIKMIDASKYPAYELIVKHDLSEDEVQTLLTLCSELTDKLEQQKEEGFVYFTPLLTQFEDYLNKKLEPEETILAFLDQGMFSPLMEVLKKTLTIVRK